MGRADADKVGDRYYPALINAQVENLNLPTPRAVTVINGGWRGQGQQRICVRCNQLPVRTETWYKERDRLSRPSPSRLFPFRILSRILE
jgi:hypothetical protein